MRNKLSSGTRFLFLLPLRVLSRQSSFICNCYILSLLLALFSSLFMMALSTVCLFVHLSIFLFSPSTHYVCIYPPVAHTPYTSNRDPLNKYTSGSLFVVTIQRCWRGFSCRRVLSRTLRGYKPRCMDSFRVLRLQGHGLMNASSHSAHSTHSRSGLLKSGLGSSSSDGGSIDYQSELCR